MSALLQGFKTFVRYSFSITENQQTLNRESIVKQNQKVIRLVLDYLCILGV